ncbi:hypothetical protein PMAYCL1PPCAC_28071, partial [Pristionchus mayeri]
HLELELLAAALRLAVLLVGVLVSPLLSIQLHLHLANALLQLLDDLLATLECGGLGVVQAHLHLLELRLETLSDSVDVEGVLLFLSQFLSETGCIGSGLKQDLVGGLELSKRIVELHGDVLELALKLSLDSVEGVELVGHIVVLLAQLDGLSLCIATGALCGFRLENRGLLLLLQQLRALLRGDELLSQFLPLSLLLLDEQLQLAHALHVLLDRSLRVGIRPVRVVQTDLQLVDVCLELLLDAKSLLLGASLRLESGLHGLECSRVVSPRVLELLLLLLDA